MIPIVDRKWSQEENQNGLDSSYWIIVSRLLSQQKSLIELYTPTFWVNDRLVFPAVAI